MGRTRHALRPIRSQNEGRDASGGDSPSLEKRTPQLTRTNLNRMVHPQHPAAPAGPERNHCHTISYEVNTLPLQHTLNRLNILHIHADNANAALDLAVTALNDFKLKRDTIQTKNYVPAQ